VAPAGKVRRECGLMSRQAQAAFQDGADAVVIL
jgi:hypothetical protein